MLKEQMMQDIYRVLVIFLGEPPREFRFETHDKNGKFVGLPVMTPIKFMKDVVAYPVK
jgi:bleomycin hydrolase